MKNQQTLKYKLFSGWIITALSIFAVALIAVENHSHYFWYRVIWAEVLCLFFWGSISFYTLVSAVQKNSISRFGGITPTISIVTALYAILSFFVMIIHSLISGSDTTSRIYWILQIVLGITAVISIIILTVSHTTATSGFDFDTKKAIKPKDLHDRIAFCESLLNLPSTYKLKFSMKQLREALLYSLSESTSLANLPEYQELCREILTLCDSVARLPVGNDKDPDQINSLIYSANTLITKTKLIANKQVRR